jgi:hypothetical protein
MEIIRAVQDRKSAMQPLRDRFEEDYNYYRLTAYNRGKDYKSFTSNQPRTLADKLINLLAEAPYQIWIPVTTELEGERESIAKAERFLIGMLNIINERANSLIQPNLISQLVWHSVVRGWYAMRAYIVKANDGSTRPRVDVWDMLHTYYDIGDDGLSWVCHTRTATASQLKAEYGIEVKTKQETVYDFWDSEIYAVIVNNQFVIEPTEHGLERLPVLVKMTGATPPIEPSMASKTTDTIKDIGESWLGANRHLIEPMNELFSDLRTIVARGAKVPMKAFNVKELDDSPWRLDKSQAALIPLKRSTDRDLDQDIVPMIEPTMPKDALTLANIFSAMWQQGGLPLGAWGDIGFQISGYLFNQLRKQMASAIAPAGKAVEEGMEWLFRELLLQFGNDEGFQPVKVQGQNLKGEYFGPMELKPAEVKGDWFPRFKFVPQLPEDEMEKYAMARIAHEGERPLLSTQTINEKILGIQDPDLEERIKLEEWAMTLPPIRLRRVATALEKRGKVDLADEILSLLGEQIGGGRAPEPRPSPFETGVPNTILAPEMLGRKPSPESIPPEVSEEMRLRRLGLQRG